MSISETITEGGYRFKCTVKEGEDAAFSCVIAFTLVTSDIWTNVDSVKMEAHFGSAVVALRAAEHYGRQLICQHSDLTQFFKTKTELE